MKDNGLPYFRPGENRAVEMPEQLQVLEAQERERIYQERMRLWDEIGRQEVAP